MSLEEPLQIRGNVAVAGDPHVPYHSMFWINRLLEMAAFFDVKKLLIPGDFYDADCFSPFPKKVKTPFRAELKAGRLVFKKLLSHFQRIYWTAGNHEERPLNQSNWEFDLDTLLDMTGLPEELRRRIVTGGKFRHMQVGKTLATHGDFSKIPGRAAFLAANQYEPRLNIISAHGHRMALMMDESGTVFTIENGGLFDEGKLPYLRFRNRNYPKQIPGFTIVKNGYPYCFSLWTDWRFWRELAARKRAGGKAGHAAAGKGNGRGSRAGRR